MTKDLNKNISSIQYNSLNLPSKVSFSNGKYMDYVYSATGEKRSVTYNVISSGGNYTYCDNFIYYNGSLNKILVDGGYISISGTTPTYHYYLKDHLGNNRVVVDASGTVKQVTHYYPFGGFFGESTGSSYQTYKYNGKEFERLISEDWYDYGARHMDGMRFTTMDPMAEKYYSISPYAYCGNNPIKFMDLNGKDAFLFTWLPKGDAVGHSAIGIQERDRYGNPTGNVIVRHLWPSGGSVRLGETKEADYRKEIISEDKLSEFKGGEDGGADGILKISENAAQDKKLSTALDKYEVDNPNYKLGQNDCANYTKSAIRSIGVEGNINSKVQQLLPVYITSSKGIKM